MKIITLREIEDFEHKLDMILHPLIISQIKDFMRVYIHEDDVMHSKALQMISIKLSQLARDLHEKDLK